MNNEVKIRNYTDAGETTGPAARKEAVPKRVTTLIFEFPSRPGIEENTCTRLI